MKWQIHFRVFHHPNATRLDSFHKPWAQGIFPTIFAGGASNTTMQIRPQVLEVWELDLVPPVVDIFLFIFYFFNTLKDHTHILFLPPVNSFIASASASIDSMSKLLVGSSWRKSIKRFSLTQSHWTLFTSSEWLCFCKVSELGFLETALP